MCGKGSNTTSTSSSTSASPQATAAYQALLDRAQGVAATPYQAYTGELTAPINSQQQAGISGINAASGQAQPAINQALGLAAGAANPLTAAQIQQYQNPYTQNVIDATQAQFNNQNAQQQQQLTGNAISQGALGGNRVGVAQANLAGQESLAQAPVIAGLYSNSYQQGLGAAERQFQQNPLAAAGSIANFGLSGQNAALTGAGAQLGAGTVQQQTQQQIDAANQAAYGQQQAYPYQQTQWLAGLDTGVGPGLGSSSTGQTTAPAPNQFSQYAGLGLAAASFLARGGGGRVSLGDTAQHFDSGGIAKTPWGGAPSWIPQITLGNAAPHAGSSPSSPSNAAPSFDYSKIIAANNKDDSPGLLSQFNSSNPFLPSGADNPFSISPASNLGAIDQSMGTLGSGVGGDFFGPGFARGGVAGYADGGAPDDDPVGDQNRAIAYDMLRKGQGVQTPIVVPTQNQGVAPGWNPDEPYRMPDQASVDDWRAGNPLPPSGVAPDASSDDDEPLPPEITGKPSTPSAGVGGADSSAMSFAPGVSGATPMPPTGQTNPPDNGGGLGLFNLSHNARSGLLAAGLGMLASRSPNLGNAIGEGGLAGMSAYGAGEERDRKVAEEAAKLSREAQQHAEEMKLKTDTQTETARHNKRTEDISEDKAPPGYKRQDDGTLAYEKGGPHDPEVIAAETTARTKKGTELDDDTVDAIAQRVAQGDTRAVIGLGRNPAGIAQIQKRVAEIFKEQGLDHEQGAKAILGNIADQAGRMTAERTQAGIASKLAVYGRNVDNAIGVAQAASAAANRTSFTPVNKAINAWKTNTGDPKIVALGQSLNTLTNEYARAIGSGHGTVHDKEQAETQLNQARSHEQLVAIMNVMRQEIEMTKKSMPEARQEMRDLYSKPSSENMRQGTTATPPVTAPPAASAPPPGAVSQRPDRTGKMWYFGADGQLLPGQ
jgi:hypothetical protein